MRRLAVLIALSVLAIAAPARAELGVCAGPVAGGVNGRANGGPARLHAGLALSGMAR